MTPPKYTIKEMQEIARQHGGRCLSSQYIHARFPLKWQCKRGHTWDSAPDIMMKGLFWCVQCRKDDALEEAHEIANNRGGKCLSKEYVRNNTKMKWMCGQGHIWQATFNSIQANKTWCGQCRKITIRDMQELAHEKGGICLSKKYYHSHIKLRWKCKEGHIWKAIPSAIKQGEWCMLCAHKRSSERQRDTIENMHRIAGERGGKCLSEVYINGKTALHWSCKYGHEWESKPGNIRRGTWCPQCARSKSLLNLEIGRKKEKSIGEQGFA